MTDNFPEVIADSAEYCTASGMPPVELINRASQSRTIGLIEQPLRICESLSISLTIQRIARPKQIGRLGRAVI